MNRYLSLIVLGAAFFTAAPSFNVLASATRVTQPVEILTPAEMPLSVDLATLDEAAGKHIVTYRLTNHTNEIITRVGLSIYYRKQDDGAAMVTSWAKVLELQPNSSIDVTIPIIDKVAEGNRVILLLEDAQSDDSKWEADGAALSRAAYANQEGKPYTMPAAKYARIK